MGVSTKATAKKATTKAPAKTATTKAPAKKAAKKASVKKVASHTASEAPAKRAAEKAPGAPRLVGSAGKRILQDLGLTDAELHAFLPAGAPTWIRSVFACRFAAPLGLDALARHFEGRYEVTSRTELRRVSTGPEQAPVPVVSLRPKGKYVAYTFAPSQGGEGTYLLEVAFAESGTRWGSNRAVYERFKQIELAGLGAAGVVDVEG